MEIVIAIILIALCWGFIAYILDSPSRKFGNELNKLQEKRESYEQYADAMEKRGLTPKPMGEIL